MKNFIEKLQDAEHIKDSVRSDFKAIPADAYFEEEKVIIRKLANGQLNEDEARDQLFNLYEDAQYDYEEEE